jgi:hypothetical protein
MAVPFRGMTTCTCVADWLPLVEQIMLIRGLISNSLDIYQMGYHPGYGPSGGTHDAGGCTDLGQFNSEQIAVLRWAGGTFQHRTQAQGFSMDHCHGWPWGCSHLSPAARSQAVQWSRRTNGLASYGPIQGPWPVVDYRTGITRMKKEIMAFKDDVAALAAQKVVQQLGPKLDSISHQLASVPHDTLTLDGVIANRFGHDPTNKFVAVAAALTWTGEYASRLPGLDAKVDEALAILKAPPVVTP